MPLLRCRPSEITQSLAIEQCETVSGATRYHDDERARKYLFTGRSMYREENGQHQIDNQRFSTHATASIYPVNRPGSNAWGLHNRWSMTVLLTTGYQKDG